MRKKKLTLPPIEVSASQSQKYMDDLKKKKIKVRACPEGERERRQNNGSIWSRKIVTEPKFLLLYLKSDSEEQAALKCLADLLPALGLHVPARPKQQGEQGGVNKL